MLNLLDLNLYVQYYSRDIYYCTYKLTYVFTYIEYCIYTILYMQYCVRF